MSNQHFPNRIDSNNFSERKEKDFLEEIDIPKIYLILKKSIVWVVLFFITSITVSYIYLRYTPPVFQSTSLLRIKQENSAREVNFIRGQQEEEDLQSEVELVKSKIIYDQVINNLNLWVSYYGEGRFKDEEKFPNKEYEIYNYEIKTTAIENNKLFLFFETPTTFNLSYYVDSELKEFNNNSIDSKFENDDIKFEINSKNYKSLVGRSLYFVIHNKNNLYTYLSSNLLVFPNNISQTISISFIDNNPYKAKAIVTQVDSTYLHYTLEDKRKKNQQSIDYIQNQLDKTGEDLSNYEIIRQGFSRKNNVSDINTEFNFKINKLNNYQTEIKQSKYYLENLNEVYSLIRDDSIIKSIPLLSYTEDPRLLTLSEELIDVSNEIKIIKRSRSEKSTSYKLKVREYGKIKEKILSVLLDIIESESQTIQDIELIEKNLFLNLQKIPSKVTEQIRIDRQVQLYENFYMTLQQKKLEYEIDKAGIVQDFKILSPANIPMQPISPKRNMIYIYGIVIALTFSLLIIIIRYLLHNKLTTQEDFERLTDVPILGIVPKYKEKMEFSQLIVHRNPKASIGEAFRSLRTNLEFISSFNEKKIFSVTSTISGEGKTFVSTNLSAIISMSGKKVVLLDLDMRKPKVHLAFNMENNEGVSTILIGKNEYKECIQHTEVEGLDFISAGPIPPNPSELILRDSFDNLLKDLHKEYDVIVIDTPPTGLVTDGVLIMKKVDVPLYVCRSEYSQKGFEKNLNNLHKQKEFSNLSIIINGMTRLGTYGYSYGNYYEEDNNGSLFARIFSKNK